MSPRYENILDRRMMSLSDSDHLRFRQMSGTLVIGDPVCPCRLRSLMSFHQIR